MAIGRIITQTSDNDEWRRVARRSHAPRRLKWLERLLFVVGIVCLGYFVYVSVEAELYQALENRELDSILASAPPRPDAAVPSAPFMPLPGSTLGRIEIPRLGVSAIIRAGSDARTLRLAVGHIPGTALPGEIGNIGLAGHRDTFFRRLRDIRADDDIRVVTTTGTFMFKVDSTRVVSPQDTWVLNPTRTSTLTLVTCYPFTYVGSAPQRFIVRAGQSDRSERPEHSVRSAEPERTQTSRAVRTIRTHRAARTVRTPRRSVTSVDHPEVVVPEQAESEPRDVRSPAQIPFHLRRWPWSR